ncbi:transposase DNA-binding-containing protein [Aeromonas veronii]|uniref:transposase DNA-binding-containing protein n=1 Tax=Aeromonas veronii TaxID=654 RepID=UPI00389A644F
MPFTQPAHWAQTQFGHAYLNDSRRTRRLVALATALCSGQLNPDTWLGRASAFAGGIPSLC